MGGILDRLLFFRDSGRRGLFVCRECAARPRVSGVRSLHADTPAVLLSGSGTRNANKKPSSAETVKKVSATNETSPKIDIKIDFSYRTNVTNSTAAEIYKTYSPEDIYYSPELPSSAVARQNGSTFAYGKLPLMTLSDCMITRAEKVKCKNGNLCGRWKYEENSNSSDNRRAEPKPHS